MNKIDKFLRKLSLLQEEAILFIMAQLEEDYRKVPGVSALKGKKGWFKVRVGRYRIIFQVLNSKGEVEIKRVTNRDENTYKNL